MLRGNLRRGLALVRRRTHRSPPLPVRLYERGGCHLCEETHRALRRGEERHAAIGLAGILLALLTIAACGPGPAARTPDPLSGTYTASGGGGALPAVQALTARFTELHPQVNWIVTESGSNSAIKLVLSNTIDVGFVSRNLTDSERKQVTGIPIGFSGTAVVVNAANPVTNLSKDQLRRIYTGEVTSWLELGGTEPTIRLPILATSTWSAVIDLRISSIGSDSAERRVLS